MKFQPGDIIVRDDFVYPDGALVVTGFGENGEVRAYTKGGGPEYQIPASDIARFSAVAQAERTPIYKRSVFVIEDVEEKFTGWWDGESWNGWAKPKFEFAQASRVIATLCPANSRHDVNADTFITSTSEGEEESWPAEMIALPDGGSLKVYPVGAGSWIWDECVTRETEGRTP